MRSLSCPLLTVTLMYREGVLPITLRTDIRNFIKSDPLIYDTACLALNSYAVSKARLEYLSSCVLHDASIRPFRLIKVDPNAIKKKLVDPFHRSDFLRFAPVLGGKWDLDTHLLLEHDLLFKAVYRHFTEGVPWNQTEFWNLIKLTIENTKDWEEWGCTNFDEFKRRCEHLDELYVRIREGGYRTQRELESANDDPFGVPPRYPPEWHEVTVHIDRNGEFIFHEGRHRLAITQSLELDWIPCRVMVRHSEWQRKRNQLSRSDGGLDMDDGVGKFTNHPDL